MLGLLRRRRRAASLDPAGPAAADLERLLAQEPATYSADQLRALRVAYGHALDGRAQWAAEFDGSRLERAQRYLVYASGVTVTGFFLLWTVGTTLHGWGRTALVGLLAAVGAFVYVGLHGTLHEGLVRRIAQVVALAPPAAPDVVAIAVADSES